MSDSENTSYGTQRKAAAKNRTAILAAAHELLTESPTASMNEIAKRAGVGAGTLYRHFPTREDLILVVYLDDVLNLAEGVDGLLRQHPPVEAFVLWFETLAAYLRPKHGLGEALNSVAVQEAIGKTYAPVEAAIGKLIAACVAAGEIRAGVDPADVLLLMGFLWRLPAGESGLSQGHRITDIVLNGLRPR